MENTLQPDGPSLTECIATAHAQYPDSSGGMLARKMIANGTVPAAFRAGAEVRALTAEVLRYMRGSDDAGRPNALPTGQKDAHGAVQVPFAIATTADKVECLVVRLVHIKDSQAHVFRLYEMFCADDQALPSWEECNARATARRERRHDSGDGAGPADSAPLQV